MKIKSQTRYIVAFLLLLYYLPAMAQYTAPKKQIDITGTIHDEMQEPLIGVSIIALSEGNKTNLGTNTDIDGNFKLSLPADYIYTLKILYLGCNSKEVTVQTSTKLDIRLDCSYWERSSYEDPKYKVINTFVTNASKEIQVKGYAEDYLPILSHKLRNTKTSDGVLYMNDDMPVVPRYFSLYDLKKLDVSAKGYTIKDDEEEDITYRLDISTVSFVELNTIDNLLPDYPMPGTKDLTPLLQSSRSFFRTGWAMGNKLLLTTPGISKEGTIHGTLGHTLNHYPMPNAQKESLNANVRLDRIELFRTTSQAGIFFERAKADLTEQGANLSSLMQTIYTATGIPAENSKLEADPYNVVDHMYDAEKKQHFTAYLKNTLTTWNRYNLKNSLVFEKDWLNAQTNLANDPDMPISHRNHATNLTYMLELNNIRIRRSNLKLRYGYRHQNMKLQASLPNQAAIETNYNDKSLRNIHEINYDLENILASFVSLDGITLNAGIKHYFSSTIDAQTYNNVFPSVSLAMRVSNYSHYKGLSKLFSLANLEPFLKFNFSQNINEYPLLVYNASALSTHLNATNYREFTPGQAIGINSSIKPEKLTQFQGDFKLKWKGDYTLDVSAYHTQTNQLIAPVYDNVHYQYQNIGKAVYYGYNLTLSYNLYLREFPWRFGFKVAYYKDFSKIKDIYNNQPFVRLAGFKDIATVFAPNQPIGTIYGTTYQRDASGAIVKDENGNSLINNELSKIGNPNPKYRMNLITHIGFKERFFCRFHLDYHHGVDRWNGTQQFMDEQQVAARKYSKAHESYIQKAGYWRLGNLSLSTKLQVDNNKFSIYALEMGFNANNLFTISSYQGVNPSGKLFNLPLGNGLDLFNVPGLRSYSFFIKFDL